MPHCLQFPARTRKTPRGAWRASLARHFEVSSPNPLVNKKERAGRRPERRRRSGFWVAHTTRTGPHRRKGTPHGGYCPLSAVAVRGAESFCPAGPPAADPSRTCRVWKGVPSGERAGWPAYTTSSPSSATPPGRRARLRAGFDPGPRTALGRAREPPAGGGQGPRDVRKILAEYDSRSLSRRPPPGDGVVPTSPRKAFIRPPRRLRTRSAPET
jgi:hypothetical protein